MKKKFIDIRDVINAHLVTGNKDPFRDIKYPDQENLVKKKISLITELVNKNSNNKQANKFWSSILYHWVTRIVYDIIKCYFFFEKNLEKKKNYLIYNIDPSEFTKYESAYTEDIEKFLVFLAGEYIKKKKISFQIKKKFIANQSQKKFSQFHNNKIYSKSILKKFYFFFSKLFFKYYKPKIILDDVSLKHMDLLKVNLFLGQLPLLWSMPIENLNNSYDLEKRVSFIRSIKKKDYFNDYLNSILIKVLPKDYLENFDKIFEYLLKTYSFNHKNYLTCFHNSPQRKIFIELMKINKTKVFICQHGGMYGFLKNMMGEDSERLASSNYLTWGWKRFNKDKKFAAIKFLTLRKRNDEVKKLNKVLIVSNLRTNYFNKISAQPSVPSICDENWKNVSKFCFFLNEKFKSKISIRYLKKSQNSGFIFNEKKFPKFVEFDHAKNSLEDVLNEFKIVVHEGFYSTSSLETLYYDIPTLVLVNPKDINEYNRQFRQDLNQLIDIGLVHTNLNSLKKFFLKNYLSIENWWKSQKVKKVVKNFKIKYLNDPSALTTKLKKLH